MSDCAITTIIGAPPRLPDWTGYCSCWRRRLERWLSSRPECSVSPAPRDEARTMRYRSDVDGLRALAVIAVPLCCLGIPGFPGGMIAQSLLRQDAGATEHASR